MTKAQLLAAIAAADDNAPVYIEPGDGILRSQVTADVDGAAIILSFTELEGEDAMSDEDIKG